MAHIRENMATLVRSVADDTASSSEAQSDERTSDKIADVATHTIFGNEPIIRRSEQEDAAEGESRSLEVRLTAMPNEVARC